jgi:hypothetical protein
MLKSYEAIYDHGKIKWLSELPDVEQARVIITVLPQQALVNAETPKRRRPPEKLKGSGRVLGDIISSPFSSDEWDAMSERTAQQINGDPEAFK